MNFSIEQLISFVTVYEEKSFSKAAMKLGKHRTTTGQVIANLEDVLAVELFDRIGRQVEPTEDGHLLYHYAKLALEQTRVFDKVALSLSYGGLEHITIAYPSFIPHQLLNDIRSQLAEDFPTMRVNFLVRGKEAIRQGIEEGEFHFGLVNIDKGRGMYNLDSTLLGHIEFLPFVQKGGTLSQLASNKILTALRTSRQFILREFIEEGIKEKVVVSADHEECDQLTLIIKMVQSGFGWAWLPKVLSESEYVTDNLEPLKIDELKNGLKFSIALWNPHSKQVVTIKKSIIKAIDRYIQHFTKLQKE